WPRRKVRAEDARRFAGIVLDRLATRRMVRAPTERAARSQLIDEGVAAALPLYDAAQREYAYQKDQELLRDSGGVSPTSLRARDEGEARRLATWRSAMPKLDAELHERAAPILTRYLAEQLLDRAPDVDPQIAAWRARDKKAHEADILAPGRATHHHVHGAP